MYWIEAERRQHRQDLVLEILLQPALLLRVPAFPRQHADAGLGEGRAQGFVPEPVLRVHQLRRHVVDAFERFRRRHVVGQQRRAEFERGAHGGGADLEEFVQVRAGDAQVLQAFEQRNARILGLRQHTEVELQLRQLAVEEEFAVGQGGEVGHAGILAGMGGGGWAGKPSFPNGWGKGF